MQYGCGCGFETDKIIDFRKHFLDTKKDAPGTHYSLTGKRQQPKAAVAVQEPEVKAVEAKAPENKKQKPPKQPKEKRKIDTRRTVFIGGGILLVVLGCAVTTFMATNMRGNPLVIFGMAMVIAGGYLTFKGIRGESVSGSGTGWNPMRSARKELVDVTVPRPKGNENCLRICPNELGGMRFEHVDSPLGYPWLCENDNRHYFVEAWDPTTKTMVPFELPEPKYFSPKEFANIVDAEPIRRFFENHNDRLEKMAPWIFLAMCGVFLIAVLTIPGALHPKEGANLWPMMMNLI